MFHPWCQQSVYTRKWPFFPPHISGAVVNHQKIQVSCIKNSHTFRADLITRSRLVQFPRIKHKFFLLLKLPGLKQRLQERQQYSTWHVGMNIAGDVSTLQSHCSTSRQRRQTCSLGSALHFHFWDSDARRLMMMGIFLTSGRARACIDRPFGLNVHYKTAYDTAGWNQHLRWFLLLP